MGPRLGARTTGTMIALEKVFTPCIEGHCLFESSGSFLSSSFSTEIQGSRICFRITSLSIFYPVNRQLRHQNLTVDGVGVLMGSQ
jgi:hypothetical protein